MLDNSHDSQEGQGVWLWSIAAGLILFVMEFLLFAAMVPSDWEHRVNQEELTALVQAVGPAVRTPSLTAPPAGMTPPSSKPVSSNTATASCYLIRTRRPTAWSPWPPTPSGPGCGIAWT